MKRLAILFLLLCVTRAWSADVTVGLTGLATDSNARSMRNVVYTSTTNGYAFMVSNSTTVGFVYVKTTDGGATWGSKVQIRADLPVALDVWYDQWTPGDTGTLIHTWYFDVTNDKVYYRTLDTATDTLGTEQTVLTGVSSVAGRGAFCSGTKTRSGYLYIAYDIDAGAEKGLQRSTDSGATWSANLATTFVEATIDECMLFPATGTGDNNDMWAIYQDASANELTMKMWDSSAAAQVESSSMQTCVECSSDEACQRNFSGAIRLSDGHLIAASASDFVTGTNSDQQVFDVSAVNAGSLTGITTKTDISTNTANNAYMSVYVDSSDVIYVGYNGKRDGSEGAGSKKIYYTKSTDGGTSWSAGDTAYMEGTAGDMAQTWTPNSGPRFSIVWRDNGATPALLTNVVNSIAPTPTPTPTPSGQGNFFPFFQP